MENRAKFSILRFLIIGGTSKAATTSVFNYLADHPQICPAEKETRFFLDLDYPLPSTKRCQRDGPEAYLSFFNARGRQAEENWRLEATPDYLYSASTADVIHQTLPNVRLIFILREPVSRLLSWYRFGRKRCEISLDMTFDEYVALQRENGDGDLREHRHPAFYALQHGRYSIYLKHFLDVFGPSSIQVVFYEDLRRDPLSFMVAICRSLDLDETYFQNYPFAVVNKGSDVRNRRLHRVYVEGKQRARRLLRYAPKLRSLLRQIRPNLDATYEKLNVTENREVRMAPSTADFLCSYYRDEVSELKQLFSTEAPWPERRASRLVEPTSETSTR